MLTTSLAEKTKAMKTNQQTCNRSKPKTETLEKGVKYVQSQQ